MRRRDPAPVQKLNQAGTNLRVRRRFFDRWSRSTFCPTLA
jgi:hypothetical protein